MGLRQKLTFGHAECKNPRPVAEGVTWQPDSGSVSENTALPGVLWSKGCFKVRRYVIQSGTEGLAMKQQVPNVLEASAPL